MSNYANVILADRPRSYWRLDDPAASTTVTDQLGAVTGAPAGSPTFQVPGLLINDANFATLFDGVNDFLNFGDVYPFVNRSPFTIEMLILPSVVAANQILMLRSNGANGWGLQFDPAATGKLLFFRIGAGVTDLVLTPSALVVSVKHHVVVAYDGTTATIYLDGSAVATLTSTRNINGGAASLVSGGSAGPTAPFSGVLDEIAVYDYSLTQAQVTAHYNASLGQTDTPDWMSAIQFIGGNVAIPIEIRASAVTINANITASSVTLNINIAAQSVSVNDQPQYNVALGNLKTLNGAANVLPGIVGTPVNYNVTAGKTFYIFGMAYGCENQGVPYSATGTLTIAGVNILHAPSVTGDTIVFSSPIKATSGQNVQLTGFWYGAGVGPYIFDGSVWGVEV